MTRALGAVMLVLVLALSGCGSSGSSQTKTLHVSAAASLTESFTALGKQFEKSHPGTKVVLSFGPSSGLAEQIGAGSPADVFASASTTNMDTVVAAKDADRPRDFAKNSMEIVVPAENPGKVSTLTDLAKPGLKLALCQAQVPCGVAAHKVLDGASVTAKPATEEEDVKAVLTKVSLGEVDAGMVYVTDVRAAGSKVKGIKIPDAQNATTTYPIATLTHAKDPKLAREFMDLVLSAKGTAELAEAGFARP